MIGQRDAGPRTRRTWSMCSPRQPLSLAFRGRLRLDAAPRTALKSGIGLAHPSRAGRSLWR
jgi:hypothetical protein